MSTKLHGTLYDAIKEHEAHLASVIHCGVEKALIDLGPDIHNLDWASVAAWRITESATATKAA